MRNCTGQASWDWVTFPERWRAAMAISVLPLPVDIPWRRIGVSLYMIDEEVCDKKRPLAMQPSVAVFQYDPDPESLAHRAVKMGGPFSRRRELKNSMADPQQIAPQAGAPQRIAMPPCGAKPVLGRRAPGTRSRARHRPPATGSEAGPARRPIARPGTETKDGGLGSSLADSFGVTYPRLPIGFKSTPSRVRLFGLGVEADPWHTNMPVLAAV